MREILFRGQVKDKDELIGKGFTIGGTVNPISEWVYGVPIPRYPDLFLAWSEGNGEYEEITVIPETIGQYTGLTDKNGVRIFEGDILSSDKYPYTNDGKRNYFAEVVWFVNCPAFGLYTFKAPKSEVRGISEGSEFIEDDLSDMEVIGNIYDNPELVRK